MKKYYITILSILMVFSILLTNNTNAATKDEAVTKSSNSTLFKKLSNLKYGQEWNVFSKKAYFDNSGATLGGHELKYYSEVDYDGGRYLVFTSSGKITSQVFDLEKELIVDGTLRPDFSAVRGDTFFGDTKGKIIAHNYKTGKTQSISVTKGAKSEVYDVSDSGRFVSWPDEEHFYVYDMKNKKLTKLNKSKAFFKHSEMWDGETLYYFGYTKSEPSKLKFIPTNGNGKVTTYETPLDRSLYAYNAVTGEHRRLEIDVPAFAYKVKGNYLVFENDGVFLVNLLNGEQTTIYKRERARGESGNPYVFYPTINREAVYYTLKGNIMKYDIASGKSSTFKTLPPFKDVEDMSNDPFLSFRYADAFGDYLMIYGMDIPLKITKVIK